MLKVKQGQVEQLGLLFERYKKILFGFFYNLNHNRELSEDLVQNVFERILKYRKGFKGDGEFKVWMFHIARNVNIDAFRKRNKLHGEDLQDWGERLGDDLANREQQMAHSEEMKILEMAMARLDSEKREVIVLSKIDGLKYKHIGDLMRCTEGAVKVKVFRAMQALKKEYLKIQAAF